MNKLYNFNNIADRLICVICFKQRVIAHVYITELSD